MATNALMILSSCSQNTIPGLAMMDEEDNSSTTSLVDLNVIAASMRHSTSKEDDDDSRTTLGEEEKAEESQNLFMAESQWDCVGYGGRQEAVQNKTKSQPKKKDNHKKKETKNKENIVPPSNTQPKNWPHLRALVSEDILIIILSAVDDCDCTSKLAANNSDNPKGNKWTRLYNHLYGGVEGDDTNCHGLLGNRWRVIQNPTKLKAKIQDIWTYIKKEKDTGKIPLDVVSIAMHQMEEYKVLKQKDKEESAKAKDKDARLQKEMKRYSKSVGALPPSACGEVGAGRRDHSTNLVVQEPAVYSFANGKSKNPPSTPANKVSTVPRSA
jgi:hypothetical protein